MNTTALVQQHLQKQPRGEPFTTVSLLCFGSRAAIDQVLSRLTSSGKIVRLTRGVYVRPENNRFVGQVLPSSFKIVEAIARTTQETIQVSGAEAARQFGLSTQVPMQTIFLTTGRSRQLMLGNRVVTLRHVSKKKIPLPETKIGLAIVALWYLGKSLVNANTIEKIKIHFSNAEFEKFMNSREYMPTWMSNIVLQHHEQKFND